MTLAGLHEAITRGSGVQSAKNQRKRRVAHGISVRADFCSVANLTKRISGPCPSFLTFRKKVKLGAYTMERVAAGAHLPTPRLF